MEAKQAPEATVNSPRGDSCGTRRLLHSPAHSPTRPEPARPAAHFARYAWRCGRASVRPAALSARVELRGAASRPASRRLCSRRVRCVGRQFAAATGSTSHVRHPREFAMASAAAPPGIRRGARQRFLGAVLALAALLSLVDFAAAACSYDLALPDAGLSVAATSVFAGAVNNPLPTIGVCPPYAASPTSLSGATCGSITVQPNAVLAFGTCALPGAACTGATRLTLLSSAGATLSDVNRATATSFTASYAKFAQGCVLGARCSYGAAPRQRARRAVADTAHRRRVAQHWRVGGEC